MNKPNKSTLRYVAKQGYQLMLMTGKRSGRVAGLTYEVFPQSNNASGPMVLVHLGNEDFEQVRIAKCWASFL